MWTKGLVNVKTLLQSQFNPLRVSRAAWPLFCFSSTKKNKKIIERNDSESIGPWKTNQAKQENIQRPSTKPAIQKGSATNMTFSSYTADAEKSINAGNTEKSLTKGEEKLGLMEKDSKKSSDDLANVEEKKERLSKVLSRTNVCSRRQAERMIQAGMVLVDNKKISENVLVSSKNKIKIFTKHGEKTPVKEQTRVWIFYKPAGLISTHSDPQGRPTVFEYLRNNTKIGAQHIMSVGRLDFNSEGLLILTNDGELARAMELPESGIERTYEVRVYGTLDEKKLEKIRKGVVIKNVEYGPFAADIIRRQTSNTWLRIRMTTGKNREIRRVMQKFDLRVNRLKRIKYGSYTLLGLKPGEVTEVNISKEVRKVLYFNYRAKLSEAKEILDAGGLNEAISQQAQTQKLVEGNSVRSLGSSSPKSGRISSGEKVTKLQQKE